MDSPDNPAGKSPRSLQGPRPTPLRVRKDSHKIRKPPIARPPQQQHHHQNPPPPQPYRPPVIIYTVSPKVIHTNPSEFMNLVQRLTGPSAVSPAGSSFSGFQDGGAVSPAVRIASIENAGKLPDGRKVSPSGGDVAMVEGVDIMSSGSGNFPGILSPGPGSLPPIPPNFFSPLSNEQNPLSFFDLSPNLHSNRNYNYMEGNTSFIMPSPSNLLSPYIISPTTQNLFNSLFD